MQKTVNQVKPAYTYYIEPKLGKIYSMSRNKEVNLDAMKAIVKSYIKEARYSYPTGNLTKKAWFLNEVDSIESKKQLYFLCRNSVRKARATLAR